MKIIFLDIDGVLNSKQSSSKFGSWRILDPESIRVLNKIIVETDAKLVISSAWRKQYTIEELRVIFRHFKIAGEIIDYTDTLGENRQLERQLEIDSWIKKNREKIEAFLILDDFPLTIYTDRHVKTEFDIGLQKEHLDLAVKILQTPVSWVFNYLT